MRPPVFMVVMIGALFVPCLLAQPKGDKPKDENTVQSESTARAIIEKAVKAHGGDVKLGRARNTSLKLYATVYLRNGDESTTAPFYLDIAQQLPDKYRSVLYLNFNGVYVTRTIVVNGDQGWVSVTGGETKELAAKEIKEAKEQMYAELVARLLTLRESGYTLRALDEIKVYNRTLVGVNVTSKGHRDVNLYFDKQTGLLMKMEHMVMDNQAKESSQEVFFDLHRDTNGPKHWYRLFVNNEHNRTFDADLLEAKFPERFDEALFQKPKDLKADKDKSAKDKDQDKKPTKK